MSRPLDDKCLFQQESITICVYEYCLFICVVCLFVCLFVCFCFFYMFVCLFVFISMALDAPDLIQEFIGFAPIPHAKCMQIIMQHVRHM